MAAFDRWRALLTCALKSYIKTHPYGVWQAGQSLSFRLVGGDIAPPQQRHSRLLCPDFSGTQQEAGYPLLLIDATGPQQNTGASGSQM